MSDTVDNPTDGTAPDPQIPAERAGDAKMIIGATLLVLAVGLAIAGVILLALRQGDATTSACGGPRVIGDAAGLRRDAEISPFNGTLGGRCEYWLVVRDGQLKAARPNPAGKTCTLDWFDPDKQFRCAKVNVDWDDVRYWPSRILTDGQYKGALEIDFGTAT